MLSPDPLPIGAHVVRHRTLELEGRATLGVQQPEASGVEEKPGARGGSSLPRELQTIATVTDDGTAKLGGMDAHLVGATGLKVRFDKAHLAAALPEKELRRRGLPFDRRSDARGGRRGKSNNDREIVAHHAVVLEGLTQARSGCLRLGEHDESACWSIEPMHEPEGAPGALLSQAVKVILIGLLARCRQKAARFVEDEERVVFVAERPIERWKLGLLGEELEGGDEDFLAGADGAGGDFGPLLVDVDAALFDERARPAPREVRNVASEELIEPQPPVTIRRRERNAVSHGAEAIARVRRLRQAKELW